ncbi:hypothetical protein GCM10009554_43160 [Kribbella koreensis]|uniref:Uncharacterized protein n=1 Tax=Kribbella koreensis TaxID=57909 RepID=A0ABP4BB54_9ACTN
MHDLNMLSNAAALQRFALTTPQRSGEADFGRATHGRGVLARHAGQIQVQRRAKPHGYVAQKEGRLRSTLIKED